MYKKAIVSGGIIEVYEMEYEPFAGKKNKDKDDYDPFGYQYQTDFDNIDKGRKMESAEVDLVEKRRKQTARDARNKVRRLALSNFSSNSKFLTLTFKENITDLDKANKFFKSYMRKLRERLMKDKQFKYISVIEFQKRGAVHYHVLCNIPFTPHEILLEWWKKCIKGEGSVNVQNIKHVDNVGAYIVKYMMKNSGDSRLKGKKMYLTSKGLEQPKVYKAYEAELIIDTYIKDKEKEIFTNTYDSEYLGQITYKEYNLKTNKEYRENKKRHKSA